MAKLRYLFQTYLFQHQIITASKPEKISSYIINNNKTYNLCKLLNGF